ncbi:aldehyde ferredoxin oxidoreductase family protein, partial [bacterium]|nr:aldehyde ferredoxin oxidoreductase family protein [bacterium]
MSYGYQGKILEVDLTTQKISQRKVKEEDVKKYFMGSGLAAKILSEEADLSLDPFDPANPLIFMAGLLTGTMVPTACKLSVCSKSPLTGIWNEATVGGHWPAHFKFTGYDGIIIRGKSDKPVYLWINDAKCEMRNAESVWGRDTFETSELLKKETDDKALVAAIGQAGENLSRMASIVFDGMNARIAARGGPGAVMGSKNLKAIVVKGNKRPEIKDWEGLRELLKKEIPIIKEKAKGLSEFGTAGGAVAVEAFADLPIKNWQLGSWEEGIKKISGQRMRERIWVRHYHCYSCPIGCAKIVKGNGKYGKFYGHYPEYETVGMLGANCLNDDLELLAYVNELCNKFGLDTISTGSTIAFAMECYEKGKITKEDTGGLEIKWGDSKAMITLINQIAKREGFVGEYLADGPVEAAKKIGKGTMEFVSQTKGLDYPAHDPRGHFSMALSYATSVRGACHLEGLTYFLDRGLKIEDFGYTEPPDQFKEEDKPEIVYNLQNFLSVYNPLGICKFLMGRAEPSQIARWVNRVTGFEMDMKELLKIGERIFNLKRL